MFRVLGIYNFGSKCFTNKKGKAVYKKNKVKIPMVHFLPILQITFLAFVIRKHEKAFVYGGIGTGISSPFCPPIRIYP